jgi:hypothetical protein
MRIAEELRKYLDGDRATDREIGRAFGIRSNALRYAARRGRSRSAGAGRARGRLRTPRVWPGAVLVDSEIAGTWRRARHAVTTETWERLTAAQRDAVEAEAHVLPLPGLGRPIEIVWDS